MLITRALTANPYNIFFGNLLVRTNLLNASFLGKESPLSRRWFSFFFLLFGLKNQLHFPTNTAMYLGYDCSVLPRIREIETAYPRIASCFSKFYHSPHVPSVCPLDIPVCVYTDSLNCIHLRFHPRIELLIFNSVAHLSHHLTNCSYDPWP